MTMARKDDYYNRSKQEGYRARSAYKLKQLDETAGLFGPGNVVVDLGAAPGGWLQIAAEAVGDDGTVIGVDRQRINPLEDVPATVELVRGDMTEPEPRQDIAELAEQAGAAEGVDVVVSDMAPEMTGDYDLDHARSIHLARQAFETAEEVLATGGDLVVKVFDGRDLDELQETIEQEFEYVREVRPDASRDSSSELYLVAKHYLTAPVREGDELTVTIEDVGDEGDGIAKVNGFTVFVPETEVGDEVNVRITDLRARFGFAERVE
jgi:23S rRNA (uridine2552-2'-O)-methyltransferase